MRTLKLSGHVGFDSLPDQLVNKSVQNGFVFNILCIGESMSHPVIHRCYSNHPHSLSGLAALLPTCVGV